MSGHYEFYDPHSPEQQANRRVPPGLNWPPGQPSQPSQPSQHHPEFHGLSNPPPVPLQLQLELQLQNQNQNQNQLPHPLTQAHQPHLPIGPPLNLLEHGAHVPHGYYDPSGQLAGPQQLSSANLARWFEHDAEVAANDPKNAVRIRRRATPGGDHVKHRRTRSGCYTCRSRRVKCDEGHPVCERCKKGSRDCLYPEPSSATKTTSGSKLGQAHKPGEESEYSTDEYEDEDILDSPNESAKVDAGVMSSQRNKQSASKPRGPSRKQSRAALSQARAHSTSIELAKEKSLSPSTDGSFISQSRSGSSARITSGKLSTISTNTSYDDTPWSHLPQEHQFFLDYHRDHINHNHYFFKHASSQFVHNILVNIALEYEPLVYAVMGFAAYHYTIKKPNGRISDFLGYYNKSVSLLRRSLQASHKHTVATLLTILQLAAFEEYLGDWVNLMAHQKAAFEMLNELYNPETCLQEETSRKIFDWYARFDLFAGLMAGAAATLPNEWFYSLDRWYLQRAQENPSNIDFTLESLFASSRVIGVEMAQLFGKLGKSEINIQDFMQENTELAEKIRSQKTLIDSLLEGSKHKVMSFEGAPDLDPDDIVNPYQPGLMLKGPLFSANYMLIDWYAIDAMHKFQTSLIFQQLPPSDLVHTALEQSRIFEGIEFWPESPAGSLLPAHASLSMICLFLPKEERFSTWCRRKLAKIEAMGYIFPPTLRTKMAEHWGIPSLVNSWLPDEAEIPPIIRSIRAFVEERTTLPRTQGDQDIRQMKAIFSKMSYDDSPKDSPESANSTIDSIISGGSTGLKYGSPHSGTNRDDRNSPQFDTAHDGSRNAFGISPSSDLDAPSAEQPANWDGNSGLDQAGYYPHPNQP